MTKILTSQPKSKRRTCVMVVFPYKGDDDDVRERLVALLQRVISDHLHDVPNTKALVVVNKDTIKMGIYDKFIDYLNRYNFYDDYKNNFEVLEVWSVDTCQMWLHGYGYILDKYSEHVDGILQIPGDLKYIKEFNNFVNNLRNMKARIESGDDFIIGEFEVEPYKSKHLIDLYGTYPLLYNWFPDIANKIRNIPSLGIKRVRSEFIAFSLNFLKEILPSYRKFAYEQTLAFLIYALSTNKWKIGKVDIGEVGDYSATRGFKEAIDQIERTDRLLRILWRELNGGDSFDQNEFEKLSERARAITKAALVSFANYLKSS